MRPLARGCLLCVALLCTSWCRAQVLDDFSDGDFTDAPPWTGDVDAWRVEPVDGDPALRTRGAARADTLSLATPSDVAFGRWRFTVGYLGGRLSNFNLLRIYLVADGPLLEGPVRGYYVQLGTNSRDVRLYRSDPTRADGRVLLARSDPEVLADEARTLTLEVERTDAGTWTVAVDGVTSATAQEAEPGWTTSTHLGVWVKHSATRGDGYHLDDVAAAGAPGPADRVPPRLSALTYAPDGPALDLAFTEPLAAATVRPAAFEVRPGGAVPIDVVALDGAEDAARWRVVLPAALAAGSHALSIRGVQDVAGNAIADTSAAFDVAPAAGAPAVDTLRALGPATLEVVFTAPVRACRVDVYDARPLLGRPAAVAGCAAGTPGTIFLLTWTQPMAPFAAYVLTVEGATDGAGVPLPTLTGAWTYLPEQDPPAPGDLVVNEVFYAPDESAHEFVEFLNRSERTFDVGRLAVSDDRRAPVPVSPAPAPWRPGEYLVVARDTAALAARFDGVRGWQPPTWPALNNGGDAALLWHDGVPVDSVTYTPSWGGDGVSLERRDPGAPADDRANWAPATEAAVATPGARNSRYEVDVTPPVLVAATSTSRGDSVVAVFSEAVDPATVPPDAFVATGPLRRAPASTRADGATVTLGFAPPLRTGDYVLAATGVADRRGNMQPSTEAALTVFAPGAPRPGELVVNEIHFAPADPNLEFVEIYNRSDETFDVSRLALADGRRMPRPVLGPRAALPPGGYLVLARDSARLADAFPGVAARSILRWPTLNDGGDAVVLYHLTGVLPAELESVTYLPEWGTAGRSLERKDPDGPATESVHWAASPDALGATPGRSNAAFASDAAAPELVGAEEQPTLGPAVPVRVRFDEPVDAGRLARSQVELDAGPVDSLRWATTSALLVFTRAPMTAGRVVVRDVYDLKGNRAGRREAVIVRQPGVGDVVVTEILADPLADADDGRPDQPEFVELLNTTDRPVTLRGAYWTDRPDETGAADTLGLPDAALVVPASGRAVVFAQPDDLPPEALATASRLAAAFGPDLPADVLLVPIGRSTLGLANDADQIRLQRADGTELDAVTYAASWHRPDLASTRGTSLERIDAAEPSDDRLNWTSSRAPRGSTPGAPNSVRPTEGAAPEAGDLVITEIMYDPLAAADDGRPDQPEYVEWTNRAAGPVSLTGLFLTGPPDENGRADTLRLVSGPVSLPPRGHAVAFAVPDAVAEPSAWLADAFASLRDGDDAAVLLAVRGASLGLSNAGERLQLHAGDGTLVDAVPYEPGWHAAAVVDARGIALERLDAAGPSASRLNWTSSPAPEGGTPGRPNAAALPARTADQRPGVVVVPSPFSPDRDGRDDVAAVQYRLREPVALVRARIFDQSGRLVRTLEEARLSAAAGTLAWDGLDDGGRPLRIGIYVVLLEAVHAESGASESYRTAVVLARPLD